VLGSSRAWRILNECRAVGARRPKTRTKERNGDGVFFYASTMSLIQKTSRRTISPKRTGQRKDQNKDLIASSQLSLSDEASSCRYVESEAPLNWGEIIREAHNNPGKLSRRDQSLSIVTKALTTDLFMVKSERH